MAQKGLKDSVVAAIKHAVTGDPGFGTSYETRLSECQIWPMLEQVYSTGGKALWEQIPYYVTSSTFIAESYAELIVSWLLDYYDKLDHSEPVYIVEMGTGTGCFSFYCVKELHRKLQFFPKLADIKVTYVMTDFSTTTIESWEKDQHLAPYREKGFLDFAVFKPEEQTEIVTYKQTKLAAGLVKNPIIAVANYFFDSLHQDAFRVDNHQLQEVLHTFAFPPDSNPLTGSPFELLQKRETYADIKDDYYKDEGDPILDKVLKWYAENYDYATIIFPIGAFRTLNNLRKMCDNKLILISTDKGFTNERFMAGLWEQPFCAHHGVFSYAVNYHAIAKYFEFNGGCSFATHVPAFSVETQMSVMLPDLKPEDLPLSRYHFAENVTKKNSVNYMYHAQNLLFAPGTCSKPDMLRAYISFVRMSNCDPISLYLCGEMISDCLNDPNCTGEVRNQLSDVLDAVEANFYHVRNRNDVLYHIGKIRYMLDKYETGYAAFEKSINTFGPNSYSLYYGAACLEMMKEFEKALDWYRRTLTMDPNCDVTKRAIARMSAKVTASKHRAE